jgi:hypothetical protein
MAVASLGACGLPSMTASAEREAEAQALVEDIAAGREAEILRKMASNVDPAQVRAQMPFVRSLVPTGPVPQGVTVGWRANAGTGGSTYVLNRTYDYPDRTLTVETVFAKQGGTWKVAGFNVAPTMKPGATPPAADGVAPETATAAGTAPSAG